MTLKTSFSEDTGGVTDYFDSLPAETLQPCSTGGPFDSSKIKAAIEVLQSLSKPRSVAQITSSSITINGGTQGPDDLSKNFSMGLQSDVHNNQNMDMSNSSSSLVPAVGEKAIVFSQWTRMLDLLEACLKDSSINYRRLDGTMSVIARDKAVKDFNTQPEVRTNLKICSIQNPVFFVCVSLLSCFQ